MPEKIFLYFQGVLVLELCGESKERFLNLCKNNNIEILHIFKIDDIWYLKIRYKNYKNIRSFLKKTGCECKIIRETGAPCLIRKLQHRKGLLVGAILFLFLINLCSRCIWKITVEGGFLHTREQMMKIMESECKIYGGIPKNQVDCFEIEKMLRLKYSEIGWISVEKKGVCLNVRLNESTMPSVPDFVTKARHIVAERDGVVCGIEVVSGIPMVQAGDRVEKGDILISGIVPVIGDYDLLIRNEPVVAKGKVALESEFLYTLEYPMVYEQKNITDIKTGLEIFLLERKLFSYIPRYSDGNYDIMSIDIVPYRFADYSAPVLVRKYNIMHYYIKLVQLEEAEAITLTKQKTEEFLSDWEEQEVQIRDTEFVYKIENNTCRVSGTITALGNFISYQEISTKELEEKNEYSRNNP